MVPDPVHRGHPHSVHHAEHKPVILHEHHPFGTPSEVVKPPPRPGLDFAAGVVSGMAGVLVGHPFDTVKTRFQQPELAGHYSSSSTFATFRTIMKEERLAGLYKGIVSPLAGIGIVNGLVFSAFKKSLDYLSPLAETPEGHEPKLSLVFLAGCASGVVGSIIDTPTELLKVRQQSHIDRAPGTLELARNIYRTEGPRGIYRGYTSCLLRDLGYGPYFLTYELLLRTLAPARRNDPMNPDSPSADPSDGWWAVAVAGAAAGVVSWLTTFPFDVVKTRIQSTTWAPYTLEAQWALPKAPPPNPYRSTLSTINHSLEREGWRCFYRGLSPTLLRAIPVNVATFSIYELVLAVC